MIDSSFVLGGSFIAFLFSLAAITVAVLLTLGVHRDLKRLEREGKAVEFMPWYGWILMTAAFGPVGFVAYWLVHCSTLRQRPLPSR
jgi:cell division protein FtsX